MPTPGPVKATSLAMSALAPNGLVHPGDTVALVWANAGPTGDKDYIQLLRAGDRNLYNGLLDSPVYTGGLASGSANAIIPTNLIPGGYEFWYISLSTAHPTPSFVAQSMGFYVVPAGVTIAGGLRIVGAGDQAHGGYDVNGRVYLDFTIGTPNAGDTIKLFPRGSTSPVASVSTGGGAAGRVVFDLGSAVGANQYFEFGLVSGVDGTRVATSEAFVVGFPLPVVSVRRVFDRIATNGSYQDVYFHTSQPHPNDQIFLRIAGGTWWQPEGEGFKSTGGLQDGYCRFLVDSRMTHVPHEGAFVSGAVGQVAVWTNAFDVLVSV